MMSQNMIASVRALMLQAVAVLMMVAALATGASAVPIAAGLELQYDGTNVTTTGIEVTSWNNQGIKGAEGNVVPRLATARPTLLTNSLNGQDVINYAGQAQEVLRSGLFTTAIPQANTMFMVMRDQGTNSPVTLDGVQGLGGRHFFRPQSTGNFHLFAGVSITGGTGALKNQYMIYTARFDQASSTVHANGNLAFSVGATIGTEALAAVAIGNSDPNGSPASLGLTGQIAEVLFYDTPLDSAQQLITENYLSSKFNIGGTTTGAGNTLGANDRYVGDLSTNGDFDSDVFGIGSDLTNAVIDSGFSAGLSIKENNLTLDSNEWVLAGHNVENNSLTIQDLMGTGLNNRSLRVWYVDKTAVDGVDATLTFKLSGMGLSGFDFLNYGLLYRSGISGDFTNLGLTALISGDEIAFDIANSLLVNGQFTLGVNVPVPEPSSFLLLGLGALGLMRHTRRRRRKA